MRHTAAVTLCPLQTPLNSLTGSNHFHFSKQLGVMISLLPHFRIDSANLLCYLHSKHTCNRPVFLITHEVWHCLSPLLTWVNVSRICTLSFCLPISPQYMEKPSMLIWKHRSNSITPSTLIKPSSGSLDLETLCQLPLSCSCHLPSNHASLLYPLTNPQTSLLPMSLSTHSFV